MVDLYVIDNVPDVLWLIDSDDPDSTAGGYGSLGTVGGTSPRVDIAGLAFDGSRLLAVSTSSQVNGVLRSNLWHIDPESPGSPTSLGLLPSGLENPRDAAYGNGQLWVVGNSGADIWRIDPDNPGSTTSPYGRRTATTLHEFIAVAPNGAIYTSNRAGNLFRID